MAPDAQTKERRRERQLWILAIVAGAAFGLFTRLAVKGTKGVIISTHAEKALQIGLVGMSFTFVFIVPLCIGALTVAAAPRRRWNWQFATFGPWAACIVAVLIAAALHLEGSICIVFMAPALLLISSIGGLLTWRALSKVGDRGRTFAITATIMLPFIAAPLESLLETPTETRDVTSEIRIDAPPAKVWGLIKSVDEIRPDEGGSGWSQSIGFPRPISATLSHEGVGGVRHATFDRDVVFTETVDKWEENKLLSFSIKPESMPATSLDEHVAVGGAYFDVLRGTYELVEDGQGTFLRLTSSHRLSTNFNRYAALWSDFVMRDIQSTILAVVKNRAESPFWTGTHP